MPLFFFIALDTSPATLGKFQGRLRASVGGVRCKLFSDGL